MNVMEIDDFKNESMRETEDDINRRLLQNHEDANKGCSRKNKSPVWAFSLQFLKLLAMMELSGIISHYAIVLS